jgi:hypothetical protein
MNVKLHIERVIVDGVALGEGSEKQLRLGLAQELTALFLAQGVPECMHRGDAIPTLKSTPLVLSPNKTSVGIGEEVAHSASSSFETF